ncbi:hypothetical protein X801_09184 [Opisthorchis viverrini]|uniref:Ku70/Ku80 C-terminal arm domain-containing protein n=1 Tax=Opisthorchis viverrini TaxID=6198 RepID=A0A1S8WKR7_OPIVI|nr:hypothetical protein X801_09184 [Opisthorchis viverrini]
MFDMKSIDLDDNEENLDEDGAQVYPPGFHIIFLPYCDDFRDLELPEFELGSAYSCFLVYSDLSALCFSRLLPAGKIILLGVPKRSSYPTPTLVVESTACFIQSPKADTSEEQVEAAKAVVKKLMVPYDPRQISNPILQRHYAVLEALALHKDHVDDVPDSTTSLE